MTLDEIRVNIDDVDRQMKKLFLRRMELADQVAQVKAESEDVIYKPDREAAIIRRQSEGLEPSIQMEYRSLIRRIMEISRKYQYGRTLELRDCFPWEYETVEPPVSLCAVPGNMPDIRDLSVKPVKDGTGRADEDKQFFVNALALRHSVSDDFAAAEAVCGGIADTGAGVVEIIGHGANGHLNEALHKCQCYINRCIVVRDENTEKKLVTYSRHLSVCPDHNRVKLVFICPNHSGSLSSILSMIADYGVNLTEIYSVPFLNETEGWNYKFFLELSMNMGEKTSQSLLYQLSCEAEDIALLGSYRCEDDGTTPPGNVVAAPETM